MNKKMKFNFVYIPDDYCTFLDKTIAKSLNQFCCYDYNKSSVLLANFFLFLGGGGAKLQCSLCDNKTSFYQID